MISGNNQEHMKTIGRLPTELLDHVIVSTKRFILRREKVMR